MTGDPKMGGPTAHQNMPRVRIEFTTLSFRDTRMAGDNSTAELTTLARLPIVPPNSPHSPKSPLKMLKMDEQTLSRTVHQSTSLA